ncbi:ABC transporter permease [Burkholderia ubonensis]|uniref:ABC transporter permease n=1 Tax=Burkholderia ubonensis TaxID=101571 RepID=UPI000758692A|nr:ABC transporter permease [Burkholderia ubonensis]KVC86475.1 ABC transporter permease [Burkholderia ubonensis]KVD31542.1 ABC transporter permease [Burkholderia ubonensis]KVL67766.1 ABC transporter permease [Burkholderia ubonensis]KVL77012.1 ABC transporter permease [Burkholderia ubonensis]KVL85499.1 ABC transporter permease [Burkholderia ubonensis]
MTERQSDRYGPRLRHVLVEPFDNLRLLRSRALLALLGIAVGCASVVCLLNIGHNAANEVIRTFKGLGSNIMVASFNAPPGIRLPRGPATLDMHAATQALPGIQHIAPVIVSAMSARLDGRTVNASVVGTTSDLRNVLKLSVARGRFLSRYDRQSTYAVVGAKAFSELNRSGRPISVGDRIALGNYTFEIVGVLAEQGANPMIPVPLDEGILIPIEGMRRIVPAPEINTLIAVGRQTETLQNDAAALRDYLTPLARGRDVQVQVAQQLLDGLAQQNRTFSWLLLGLGIISLLIGGIGVMNVMLMSVAERRREIGVRMALGARPRDIATLFVLEAAMLAVAGALAGAAVGLAGSWLFAKLSGWAFSLSAPSLPLGIASSLGTGVFFGLHPALMAARLEPVRALRDD